MTDAALHNTSDSDSQKALGNKIVQPLNLSKNITKMNGIYASSWEFKGQKEVWDGSRSHVYAKHPLYTYEDACHG